MGLTPSRLLSTPFHKYSTTDSDITVLSKHKMTLECSELIINTDSFQCKPLYSMYKRISELEKENANLYKLLQETRDQVQVLLDLQRMREIDQNKDKYINQLTA